jgi:hypothetical protein
MVREELQGRNFIEVDHSLAGNAISILVKEETAADHGLDLSSLALWVLSQLLSAL